jgi:hypothetical protein
MAEIARTKNPKLNPSLYRQGAWGFKPSIKKLIRGREGGPGMDTADLRRLCVIQYLLKSVQIVAEAETLNSIFDAGPAH